MAGKLAKMSNSCQWMSFEFLCDWIPREANTQGQDLSVLGDPFGMALMNQSLGGFAWKLVAPVPEKIRTMHLRKILNNNPWTCWLTRSFPGGTGVICPPLSKLWEDNLYNSINNDVIILINKTTMPCKSHYISLPPPSWHALNQWEPDFSLCSTCSLPLEHPSRSLIRGSRQRTCPVLGSISRQWQMCVLSWGSKARVRQENRRWGTDKRSGAVYPKGKNTEGPQRVLKYLESFYVKRGDGICVSQDSRTEYTEIHRFLFFKLARALGVI